MKEKSRKQILPKYLKFMISRLIGTLLETLILWLLSHFALKSYFGEYIVAPTISFEFVMLSNYVFSYFWIWNKHITNKSVKDFFVKLGIFNISSLLGFGIKMGFLLLFERIYGWDVVICNLVALTISGLLNFFLSECVIFNNKKNKIINDGYTLIENEDEIYKHTQ